MSKLDGDGQPLGGYNKQSTINRSIDEFIGLCKGVLADSVLDEKEFWFLVKWLRTHSHVNDEWPVNILYDRCEKVLEDGVVNADELSDLKDTIETIIGGEPVLGYAGMMASKLPLDNPQPTINFDSKVFCLTGKFVYGSRHKCEEVIKNFGGWCSPSVSLETDYLLIGSIGSRDWKHSTHGTKILKAIEYRKRDDSGIAIISEEHWLTYVDRL